MPRLRFRLGLTPDAAVSLVGSVPGKFADRLAGTSGRERHPDLALVPAAYVSHVADNLRIWSERLAGARLAGVTGVPGYDQDLLAQVRHYDQLALAGALWSLGWAARAWVESVEAALAAGVVLQHAARGAQRAEDVARQQRARRLPSPVGCRPLDGYRRPDQHKHLRRVKSQA